MPKSINDWQQILLDETMKEDHFIAIEIKSVCPWFHAKEGVVKTAELYLVCGNEIIASSISIQPLTITNTFDLTRAGKTKDTIIVLKAKHEKLGMMYFYVLPNIRWQKPEKFSSRSGTKWHRCRSDSIVRYSYSTGRISFGIKP